MSTTKKLLIGVCLLLLALAVAWGTKRVLKQNLQEKEIAQQAIVQENAPQQSTEAGQRPSLHASWREAGLDVEITALKAANKDLMDRLFQSVAAHSMCEVKSAKHAGKYPASENVKPGTSVIAGISVDKVFVKQEDGTLVPFTIGQTIPSAGRLIAIDVGKGEALTEDTRLVTAAKLLQGSR